MAGREVRVNKKTMLREYLRTRRRVSLRPSMEGLKKLEYLHFLNAQCCPECGEEVDMDSYICTRDKQGRLYERYRCKNCGADYLFSLDPIH